MVENQTSGEKSLILKKFRQNFNIYFKEKERRKDRRENGEESNKNSFLQLVFIGNQKTCLFKKPFGEKTHPFKIRNSK